MEIIYLSFFNLIATVVFGGMILFGVVKAFREQIKLLKACYIAVCAGISLFFMSILGLPVLPLLFMAGVTAFFIKRCSSMNTWKKALLAALIYSILQAVVNFVLLMAGLSLHKLFL